MLPFSGHCLPFLIRHAARLHGACGTQKKKSYLNVHVVVKVFKSGLDLQGPYREALVERGVAALREENFLLGEACCLADGHTYL